MRRRSDPLPVGAAVGGRRGAAAPSAGRLLARLEPARAALLREAAAEAGALGLPLYLVGGAVRDLVLGRTGPDLDLVVVGDLEALAGRLAERWRTAAPVVDRRFLTTRLEAGAGVRIDLATARSESYPRPGSLPRVRPDRLAADLARRDFAANAVALRLDATSGAGDEGPIDPCGGLEDIARRRLRVLHRGSFRDDPARILRGVRFEVRLGFAFDAETEALARDALAGGALDTVSDERLRRELEHTLAEDRGSRGGGVGGAGQGAGTARAAARLEELGALAALDPALAPGEPGARLVAGAVDALVALSPETGRTSEGRWRAAWLAVLAASPRAAAPVLAERLGADAAERRLFAGARERTAETLRRLGGDELAPSEAAAALDGLAPEELAVVAGAGGDPARRWVERYLSELRPLTLGIDGDDLVRRGVSPGPALGRALAATRAARLDGTIGAGEELAYALRRARTAAEEPGPERPGDGAAERRDRLAADHPGGEESDR